MVRLLRGRPQSDPAHVDGGVQGATAKYAEVVEEAKRRFEDLDVKLQTIYMEANKVFIETDEMFEKRLGGDDQIAKRSGLLPDKMMIPTQFDTDITIWWK